MINEKENYIMAGSVNKVILVGNLGKDPEVKMSGSGSKLAQLTIATSDSWKDKQGQKQEKTEWHRVVIFNPNLADVAEKYLKKGSKVYIEGALQTRKWTDNNGVDKYTTEVVVANFKGELTMLDSRSSGGGLDEGYGSSSSSSSSSGGWDSSVNAGDDMLDDEIPF